MIRILELIQCISNFWLWCLSLSKSQTRTKFPTCGWVHYAQVFPSCWVWFFDIDLTTKVCYFSFPPTSLSILSPFRLFSTTSTFSNKVSSIILDVIFVVSLYVFMIFDFGTNPSIISAEIKSCRQISLPLIGSRILGMFCCQLVFA